MKEIEKLLFDLCSGVSDRGREVLSHDLGPW